MHRRTRLAAVALAATLALVACSSDDDPDPGATGTATTSAAPTTDTPTGSPTDATTGSPDATDDTSPTADATTTGAGVARCRKPDVRVSVNDLDSAAGRRYAEVVLTNATGEDCRVEGYGGLQLLDATRNPVPTTVVRLTRPAARPVVLEPGQSASSQISFSVVATDRDQRRGPCQPEPAYALVTAPDETRSTRVPWNLGPACDRGRIEQRAYRAVTG